MTNKLIESTITFAENTSKINGNLRSGVIKEEANFPDEHLKSGLKVLQHHTDNGHPEPRDAVVVHGMALGYPHKKAIDFSKEVSDLHGDLKYASGARSAGDRENMHGALGAGLKDRGFM